MRTIVLLLLLLGSCASRKVVKEKKEVEFSVIEKMESTGILKKEVATQINSNAHIVAYNNETKIKPVDNTKPMFVGGKEYTNAQLTSKESKTESKEEAIVREIDKSELALHLKQGFETDFKATESSKDVERASSSYWWLLLLIPLYLLVRYIIKKI